MTVGVRLLPLYLSALALLAGASAAGAGGGARSMFTDEQAQAGAQLYATRCAMCHGKQREGTFETPALQERFMANWSGATAADLSDYIGRAMPQFAPGTLKPQETAQIVAFLLKSNGRPAGAVPLPVDAPGLSRLKLAPAADH